MSCRGIALALLLTGCSPVLQQARWAPSPPEAPCEVRVSLRGAPGPAATDRLFRYDAEGRLLYAGSEDRFERFAWSAGQLAVVESFTHSPPVSLPCDAVGGCDSPARRTIETTTLQYSGARPAGLRTEEEHYEHGGAQSWRRVLSRSRTRHLRYEDDRLVRIEGPTDEWHPTHFAYDAAGRLQRRWVPDGLAIHDRRFAWGGERLEGLQWVGYRERFGYDDSGALVEHVRSEPANPQQTVSMTEWSYDDSGALQRTTTVEVRGGTDRRRRILVDYEYEAPGRLRTVTYDAGGREEVYSYQGSCERVVNAPRTPEPLELSGAVFCFTSPHGHMRTCWP